MTFDEHDIHSLALCVWKEARGEGCDGMKAVAHVIRNRVGVPGFAKNLHDVIYGKNQFTSMSVPSDPEFNLQPKSDDKLYAYCESMAPSILSSIDPDPTHGACYYANLKTMDKGGWFERHIVGDPANHPQTAQIGQHTFFK